MIKAMPRPQFSLKTLLWLVAVVGLFLGIGIPLVETGRLMWANWQVQRADDANQPEVEQMFRAKDEWVGKWENKAGTQE